MVFPLLFTAGMTTVDSTNGFFMSKAYQWAMRDNPIKKIWYNMTMTAVSIVVAYFVGTLELLGLLVSEMGLTGFPWSWVEDVTSGTSWGGGRRGDNRDICVDTGYFLSFLQERTA